jgi:hypothetical protein
LPERAALYLDPELPRDTVLLPTADRLKSVALQAGVDLELITGPAQHPRLAIRAMQDRAAPNHPDGYLLSIDRQGIALGYQKTGGFLAGVSTLRQLVREYGRRLPQLTIRDYPDFPRRGVMLDVSRGRVPTLETLLQLVEDLADFKINEFQLYLEHTFAYRNYEPVWRDWGALTGEEILKLDARCRQLGIDLVPNQNSFGHMRYWLEYPPLRKLAEVSNPYESADGQFLRYPTTLSPNRPGTLPFVRELFDELLPCFTSSRFNVGCDETWDLGRGQSKRLCESKGKGRVYFEFLKKIHREATARGRQMMFWGDIILHHPELIKELPQNVIALNWGYEANHPFEKEARLFSRSGRPFYVCPGTSTWMTLIGRHDNALANLSQAAEAGKQFGAAGYLNTDWGDGGHPQPLAVSYLPYLAGAALSWCAQTFNEQQLVPVLSRDIFHDPSYRAAKAAFALGFTHRKLRFSAPNVTPLGAVIAAPPPEWRELFCRDGLKYYARIPHQNIVAAQKEISQQRDLLGRSSPSTAKGEMLVLELDLAARMAEHSCKFMLWQQALAGGRTSLAKTIANKSVRELRRLDHVFRAYWPLRNKGTTEKCSAFLRWRIDDYQQRRSHLLPALIR